jgi:hypothetical protein
VYTQGIERVAPWISLVIRQGVEEGVFQPAHPEQVSEVVLSLLQTCGDSLTRLILSLSGEADQQVRREGFCRITSTIAAYNDAIERVLGAAPGALKLFDAGDVEGWILPSKEKG